MIRKRRPLQVSFYDDGYGWILLRLNLPEKTIKINLSGAFDPLPDLFNWIEDIYMGNLPSDIEIDQEDKRMKLIASVLTKDAKDSFLLKIFNVETEQLVVKSELPKRDFIRTFANRFESFVTRKKDKTWCGYKLTDLPYRDFIHYDMQI